MTLWDRVVDWLIRTLDLQDYPGQFGADETSKRERHVTDEEDQVRGRGD